MSLTFVSTLIDEGKNEEALESLKNMEEEEKNSISFYKLRGHLYSQMGMMEDYLQNLLQAAGAYPSDEETLMELCELLFDLGKKIDAEPYLKTFLSRYPDCEWATEMLKEIPSENGLPLIYSDDFLEHYLSLFIGREGVYAKQTENINGKAGYFPVYNQFDANILKSHLFGDITAGLYLLRKDNSVTFIVIDLDVKKKFLCSLENQQEEKDLQEKLNSEVRKIITFCDEQSLPHMLEFSGYKGYHIWFFFENPVEASLAREFGKKILFHSDIPHLEIQRELFPKQDSVAEDGLGNLVKIPLGIHKKTGKRCLLLEPETFEPFRDQISAFFSVKKISQDTVNSIINLKSDNCLQTFPGEPQGAPQVLIEKCNILKFLVQKARSEYRLSKREKMVLSYILGYIEEQGENYYHWLLSHCSDYDRAEAQSFLDTLKPNPMGCTRIRYWLPYVVSKVACNCPFRLTNAKYPTPVLHLLDYIPKLSGKGDISSIIKGYVKTLSELENKKKKLISIEEKLNEVMDEKKMDIIETPIGILKRERENNGTKFSITLKSFYDKAA